MAPAPEPPPIRRRDIDFAMSAAIPRWWYRNDCHATRFYDALSISFPEGERFFIDSVRYYREQIAGDPALAEAVKGFIGQEAMHTREHRLYNERLAAQGAPVERLENRLKKIIGENRRLLPPVGQLAATACLEHFTAMLADQLLRHPQTLAGADPRMAGLWRWHALEETEHKAVAFDVFQRVGGSPGKRYLRRCRAMLLVSMLFVLRNWQFHIALVRADGRGADWRGWLRELHWMFVSPGPLLRILPAWLAWFRPGFHPWQHDNRALLAAARAEFDPRAAAP